MNVPQASRNWVCGACTTAAIHYLSTCKSAEDAMAHFCKSVLKKRTGNKYNYYDSGSLRSDGMEEVFSYYVFTAGPEDDGYGYWPQYGTKFAAYITEHGLGVVASPGQTENRKFHPGNTCQTWVWMPDRDALGKWWLEHQARLVETKPKRARKPRAKKVVT